MQAGVGLLVADVMPTYMIMPRYSHNYALSYQLLDSNLFTHRNNYAILKEATSETYGPRVYLLSYKFSIYFYWHLLFSNLYHKNTKKIFILSYYLYQISLLQVSLKGLTTPLSRWLRGSCLFVQARGTCEEPPTGLIPWFSKLREILMLLCCITVAGEVFAQVKTYQVPITNSSPSHYIISHLPLVFLSHTSALPFYSPSLFGLPFSHLLFVCSCVGLLVCRDGSR